MQSHLAVRTVKRLLNSRKKIVLPCRQQLAQHQQRLDYRQLRLRRLLGQRAKQRLDDGLAPAFGRLHLHQQRLDRGGALLLTARLERG